MQQLKQGRRFAEQLLSAFETLTSSWRTVKALRWRLLSCDVYLTEDFDRYGNANTTRVRWYFD